MISLACMSFSALIVFSTAVVQVGVESEWVDSPPIAYSSERFSSFRLVLLSLLTVHNLKPSSFFLVYIIQMDRCKL
jgi:hypothetical protein